MPSLSVVIIDYVTWGEDQIILVAFQTCSIVVLVELEMDVVPFGAMLQH